MILFDDYNLKIIYDKIHIFLRCFKEEKKMKKSKQIDINDYNGYFDVQYSKVSSTCKMDIYIPEGQGPFPVLVSIHGGAFKKHDKRDEEMILDMLHGLKKGYAVIGVNYRLSKEAQFPEPVKDIKHAIAYIKNNAARFNLDANRIVAWGGSAGGYFSLMSGMIDRVKYFDDDYSRNVDTKIAGLVAWFPPVDFKKMDKQLAESHLLKHAPDHGAEDSPESLFLGVGVLDAGERLDRSNPENYCHKDMCPMFIQHGLIDRIVPYQQSLNFVTKARDICGRDKIHYEIIENANHNDPLFSTSDNLDKVYNFIETVFSSISCK